jgi:hypothetical protein
MNLDWNLNRSYQGSELGKPGTTLLGWIVSVKSEGGAGLYQVRCPGIHGYCDSNEQNCEEDVVAKDALPWISALQGDGNSAIINNNVKQYAKGQFVLIRFDGPNYTSPLIISTYKAKHPVLGKKEVFDQSAPYIIAPLVEELKENKSANQGDNGCFQVVTKAAKITNNGDSAKNASKCGESGSMSDSITSFIGDFMKIIQDTDGKIGSKFVNSVTGELFEITGYIQKYLAAITGVLRGGLSWIKAIITKYVRKAIDQLVKLIMVPLKGVTSVVNETIEKVLNMIFCSFGDLESLIANLIEDLLNTLVDSALNAVFGCLDTLIDGILNEILGEVLSLIESIMGVFESIAGIIGGFGDLLGQAINAVLDFLGISCGGSGDCATDASNSLVNLFNGPGEYGLTSGLKKSLNGGLSAIEGVSGSIGQSTSKLNQEAAEYARGVELGTANVPGVSTDNEALRNAFTTANNLVADSVANVFNFCNNIGSGNDPVTGSTTTPTNPDMNDDDTSNPVDGTTPSTTTAIVVGPVDDKYDATYRITPVGSEVDTGDTQTVTITRNNDHENGIIIFAVHLKSTDTARVVGITPGITSGGDLTLQSSLPADQYATNPDGMTSPQFPIAGNIIRSEKIYFPVGTKSVNVTIPTLNNGAPSNQDEVTYTVSIYRAVDDLDTNSYPYQNLPNTSSILNSATLKINFEPALSQPPSPTPQVNPPAIIFQNVFYTINDISVTAGQPAQFVVVRSPLLAERTKIKCTTVNGTALNGTHFTGGTAIITFEPGQSTAIFSVPTAEDSSLINQSLSFTTLFTDLELPNGYGSNLGGTGTSVGTSVGSGLSATASINYSVISTPSPYCNAEILLPTAPPTCIVQEDTYPLKIGFIAKVSVPGYTLSYNWQRTYDPDSTWSDITNGTRSENVDEYQTTFGPTDITVNDPVLTNGVDVTLDGWNTTLVSVPASITYSGADTNELVISQPSYLINDEEYYRCVITATPNTPSIYTPSLELITNKTYIGITKDGVYLSSINCAPPGTLADGNIIKYPNTDATPEDPVLPAAGQCTVVEPTQNIDVDVDIPEFIPDSDEEDLVDDTLPRNPSGPTLNPTIDPPVNIPRTPVVVDPDGGVVSVPIPSNLPRYKYPPLIPITGLGFGAIAKSELDENGRLSKIVIKSKGIGYVPSQFNRCGILSSIEITNAGGYYESSPTVYVNDDPTIAAAAIDDQGRLAEIRITNPQNIVYDRIPRIFIQGGSGFGGSATAVITYVPCDEVADRYLNVVNKYNESKLGMVRVVDCP